MWEKQLEVAIKAAVKAAPVLLDFYNNKKFEIKNKSDDSPVTDADIESNKVICEFLKKYFPTYSILSEETLDNKERLNNDYVWIIDPLDGTTDFISHNDQFTINIALSYKHKIVVGVVLVPVTGEIYFATRFGGAFYSINNSVKQIHVNRKTKNIKVLISNSHHNKDEEKHLEKYGDLIKEKVKIGAAIKACLIAKGDAELYFRFNSKTKEWDTAPCSLIIKEAGGIFVDLKNKPLVYNRENVVNEGGYFVANKRKNIIF